MTAELLYHCEDSTGEGAIWLPVPGIFYWTDIDNSLLRSYDPVSHKVKEYGLPDMCSAIVPLALDSRENIIEEKLLLAVRDRLMVFDSSTGGTTELLPLEGITAGNRTNDVKASPEGRLWVGEMNFTDNDGTGQLFRVDSDLSVQKVLTGQDIPNGMVWDRSEGTMYYNDTGKKLIYALDYDTETGTFRDARIAVKVPEGMGSPDGMTIDNDGHLWVAHFGGHAICIWNPFTGKLHDKIDVPALNPASCTFGGKHNDTLFITTSRSGLNEKQLLDYPFSGSLFSVRLKGVQPGINHYPFVVDSGVWPF